MKITIFTSNQPRHMYLIDEMSKSADVYVVQECTTISTGSRDGLFRKSKVMEEYFSRVKGSENKIFGKRFVKANIYPVQMGDLNDIDLSEINDALDSDYYIVFGCSFIKGSLMEFLKDKICLNIHMGISPQYRGSSTNFWAMYDNRPEMVGATIMKLSHVLDGGDILYYSFPEPVKADPFDFGMLAVKQAIDDVKKRLTWSYTYKQQDRTREIRFSKRSDFTDEIAREYLNRLMTPEDLYGRLKERRND